MSCRVGVVAIGCWVWGESHGVMGCRVGMMGVGWELWGSGL